MEVKVKSPSENIIIITSSSCALNYTTCDKEFEGQFIVVHQLNKIRFLKNYLDIR